MEIDKLLAEFETISTPMADYRWSHEHDGGKHPFVLVISALIHGNETGSLPAVLSSIRELNSGAIEFGGRVIFTLGNPEASRQDVRFLESDLNRVFLENDLETHEARRARVLMPIFDQAQLLVDLHQTILSTEQPFYIFPWTEESGDWARAISAAKVCVDATPDPNAPITTQCADDYVRLQGKPAVTVELGRKGINESSVRIAKSAILQTLKTIDRIARGEPIRRISQENAPLEVYVTTHREPCASAAHRLRPGLINFMPIQEDEILSANESPRMIAPSSGMILFPKYPPKGKALPKEIYRIIQLKATP